MKLALTGWAATTRPLRRRSLSMIQTHHRRGHCIFMQGSRIAHAVTPVLHAREPRLTLVNSYQSLNPFSSDRTVFATFKGQDANAQYGLAAATRTVAGLSDSDQCPAP